jgi:hypothetical protein
MTTVDDNRRYVGEHAVNTTVLHGLVFDNGNGAVVTGNVVKMSAVNTVIKSNSANQAGVIVIANEVTGVAKAYSGGRAQVIVTAAEVVTYGDILVSGAIAGESVVDNAETNPSKIIGYAWENKTVGGTAELTDFLVR